MLARVGLLSLAPALFEKVRAALTAHRLRVLRVQRQLNARCAPAGNLFEQFAGLCKFSGGWRSV